MKPDFSQYGFAHQEKLILACIGGCKRPVQNWARPTIPTVTDSTFRDRPNFLGRGYAENLRVFNAGPEFDSRAPFFLLYHFMYRQIPKKR